MRLATTPTRDRDYRNLTRRNRRGDPQRSGTSGGDHTPTRLVRSAIGSWTPREPSHCTLVARQRADDHDGGAMPRDATPPQSLAQQHIGKRTPRFALRSRAYRRARRFDCGLSLAETQTRGDRSCRASAANFSPARGDPINPPRGNLPDLAGIDHPDGPPSPISRNASGGRNLPGDRRRPQCFRRVWSSGWRSRGPG